MIFRPIIGNADREWALYMFGHAIMHQP